MKDNTVLPILKALLNQKAIATQEDLAKQLEKHGCKKKPSQSKISRLLRKLGALKVKNTQGDLVYSLSPETTPPQSNSPLSQLILDIKHNEHLVVLHTSPGAAQLIARILDYQKDEIAILGTIAGDDTIFVAVESVKLIDQVLQDIKALLAAHFI